MLIGYIIIISFIFGDLNSSPSFLHSLHSKLPWVRPHLRRRQSCWPTNPSRSRLNLVFPTSRRRCSSLSVRNGLRTAPRQVGGWVYCGRRSSESWTQFNGQVSSSNCCNGDKRANGFTVLDPFWFISNGNGENPYKSQWQVKLEFFEQKVSKVAP